MAEAINIEVYSVYIEASFNGPLSIGLLKLIKSDSEDIYSLTNDF